MCWDVLLILVLEIVEMAGWENHDRCKQVRARALVCVLCVYVYATLTVEKTFCILRVQLSWLLQGLSVCARELLYACRCMSVVFLAVAGLQHVY